MPFATHCGAQSPKHLGCPHALRRVRALPLRCATTLSRAAVLVTLPGGEGRLMGDTYDAKVTRVTPDDLGDQVRGLANAGATHLHLVLDPITVEAIDTISEALADL